MGEKKSMFKIILNLLHIIKELKEKLEPHNEAIKLNPNSEEAYKNRGNAYCEIGQYEKAISDYNKAIELNPKYVAAYNNLGIVYSKLTRCES